MDNQRCQGDPREYGEARLRCLNPAIVQIKQYTHYGSG